MHKLQLPHQDQALQSLNATVWSGDGRAVTANDIIRLFADHGIDSFVTGGSPRDWLMGSVSVDIDISITESIADAKNLLLKTYPSTAALLWYDEDFGLLGWGDSESVHIDINILRDYREAETDVFTPQSSFANDYQTRDFSVNCLYYGVKSNSIYDPTGYAFDDLEGKVLRVNADPMTFARNHTLTYRIAKFLLKNYSLDDSCHAYLKSNMTKDLTQFSDQEFRSFLSAQIRSKGLSMHEFRNQLLVLAQAHQCEDVFQKRSVFFEV